MTSNRKTLNYKVVDLVESYNFHIKFTYVWVQTKKIIFFKSTGPLPSWPTAVAGAAVPLAPLMPWGTAVGPCRRPPRRYSFAKNFLDYIFLQIEGGI
jgi:hypothetical protein